MTEHPPPRWWYPLSAAVLLGITSGSVHAALTWGRRVLLDRFTWTSRDLAWMAPLGDVALFLGPAVVCAVAIAVGWRRGARVVTLFTLGALAATSVALHLTGLHPLATAALGLGAGVRLAQWGGRSPGRAATWGRRAATLSLVGVLVLIVAERRPGSSAAPAAAGRPNVLVLIWDTVRAASTSLHGYDRPTTPALQAMASEGTTFATAISPSSWTLPSHGSMFTGVESARLSASWRRPLDAAQPSVAEVLRDEGYRTGAFVGNLFYTHHESGVDRGFTTLHDFRRSPRQLFWSTALGQTRLLTRLAWARSPGEWWTHLREFELRLPAEARSDRRRASEITSEFLDWQAESTTPFFAFLNLYDAHDPYDAPEGYDSLFARPQAPRDAYDAGIRYMDDELRRVLQVLRERGVLDQTLVVVTSDHGEQWGEHGLHNHGNSLYLPVIHVPLVMRLPGVVPAGARHDAPVSLTDLASTLLAVTGTTRATLPGRSLLAGGRGVVIAETEALDPSARARSPAEHGALATIVRDSLQYLRNGDSTYQLFDIGRDPAQAHDLTGTAAGCVAAVALDSILRAHAAMPRTPAFGMARCTAVAGS